MTVPVRPSPHRFAFHLFGAMILLPLSGLIAVEPVAAVPVEPGLPVVGGAAPPTGVEPLTDDQRAELIRTLREQYAAWRFAILNRDLDQWAANTSEHRRHQVRNEVVSNGAAFPEALFEAIQPPPQVTPLRVVDLRMGADVARITFFGPLHGDPTTAPPPGTPSDLLHVVFHREQHDWKLDHISHVSLDQRPDWRQRLMQLDYALLQDPTFHFVATKPAPPALCDPPEHVAMLQIFSSGYKVRAVINGHAYPEIDDGNVHMIVIGGLRNGANELKLEMEPSVGDSTSTPGDAHVAVNLWVRPGDPEQDSSRVFHYMPRPGEVPRQHEASVLVNERTLAEGRR